MKQKLLVVDDEPVILQVLERALRGSDAEVLLVSSPAAAIEMAQRHQDISVAVVDKNLPGMTGLRLIEELRKYVPDIECIMITGFASLESAVEALKIDAFDYVKKPFDPLSLVDVVGRATELVVEKRKRQARRRHMYKMEAVGTLAASVAHEVNNPLTYVMANLDFVLATHKELTELIPSETLGELHEVISEAREGSERIRRIVRELRMFSHAQRDALNEAFDPRAALQSTLNLVGNELRHRAHLHLDLDKTPAVVGDPIRLGQVFLNVVINAVQALPDDSAGEHEIRVTADTAPDGTARFVFKDSGCGIPAENLDRIFDRFFTTKQDEGGTGLGLSICMQFISDMGGTLDVRSEEGAGTTVTVIIPPAPEQTAAANNDSDETPLDEQAAVGRVLIIDDEERVAKALMRTLSPHEVMCIHDGREAVAMLKRDREFDLVLCDIMMPEFGGVDIYRALSEFAPDLASQIVFMSGGVFTPTARRFVEEVPNRFMEKPLMSRELRGLIVGRVRGRQATQ